MNKQDATLAKLLIGAEDGKLHANCVKTVSRQVRLSQRRSMALQNLLWVKGFLTRTPTRPLLPALSQRRCSSSARHFSSQDPPAGNNDCSCVNVAARWLCLPVCASYFDGFLAAAAAATVRAPA